jgi:hypothetical protein
MRKSVLGAAALALLGTTALVSAQQGPSGGGNQPGMKEQQGQSGGSGAQQSQGSAQKGEKNEKSDSRANAPSEKGKSSAQDETKGQGKNRAAESEGKGKAESKGTAQTEGKGKAESKGTAQTEGKDKGDRNTAQDRARDQQNQKSARDRDQQNQKSARDRDNEQQKSARDRDQQNQKSARDRDNDRQKSARDREDNQRRQADDNQRRGDRDQRQQAQGGKGNETRVNISEQQRTSIHEKLSSHREARVSNVNFSINVGTRVPRSVHLSALPADVVSIVPQYRGYRYFIGPSDRIVIIQPSTLEIVEVIDVSSGPRRTGPVTASLELTPAQVSLIFDRIELSRYHADVNVNLALGAEIPSRVELYEFPQDVVSDVPELRRYRFVVVNREVVVVDPAKRDVVRVLKH